MKKILSLTVLGLGVAAVAVSVAGNAGGGNYVQHPVYLKEKGISCVYDPEQKIAYIFADFQNSAGVVYVSVQKKDGTFISQNTTFLPGGSVLSRVGSVPKAGDVLTVQGRDANQNPVGNAVNYTFEGSCIKM